MLVESFIDKCINGDVLQFEIDDYVAKWHEHESDLPLGEYLGMSDVEYNAWVLDDSVLPYIIKAHKDKSNFKEMTLSNYENIAARNSNSKEVTVLINWLKNNAQ